RVRRVGLLMLLCVCALAGALAAVVVAGPTAASVVTTSGTTGTGTTPTDPQPPPPPPQPRTIAAGVTVGGVAVGGKTRAQALAAVRASFGKPVVLRFGRHTFRRRPGRLGATAPIVRSVDRALAARPGARVALAVNVDARAIGRYVATLAARFDRPAVDARYELRGSRPVVVADRRGRTLRQTRAVRAIVTALRANRRPAIRLESKTLAPRVTRAQLGSVIVIRRGSNLLSLYGRGRLVRTFGVATGSSRYPTPLGRFTIVTMQRHPWWHPPNSDWARGAAPIPPGPGNPLGTRWMGLSIGGVGIHGTPDAASIGYSVSHGCIRMRIPEAEWLFNRVRVGTPVFVVPG
ncbi:MAG: L,D-transpeptidase/peptidoglycan binding protein, partial [Thermoleophilia bacterium]|nr:L,D-transpeptidase/peptidoglycan binding protein [Thermoleophilia bacterium]